MAVTFWCWKRNNNAPFASRLLYLKADELLFGEAMIVDYLYLFDQSTLTTLCSSCSTNQRKSIVIISLKWQLKLHMRIKKCLQLTKHEDFYYILLTPGLFEEVLFYFTALQFSLFTLLCDILAEAHSHADLRKQNHILCMKPWCFQPIKPLLKRKSSQWAYKANHNISYGLVVLCVIS